ncbi:hypothetical protein B0H66DRAFT_569862 [Apodospora peruviana]|uniref:Major facilitator superfamily transporter n=1 Tax=Apodospora peruviana TaxID=516989 RepID=A0AAE0HWJ0_9PEZI|nr:hypothetical protein B0H66DRAFT_569862 [Apodospora peruviana]
MADNAAASPAGDDDGLDVRLRRERSVSSSSSKRRRHLQREHQQHWTGVQLRHSRSRSASRFPSRHDTTTAVDPQRAAATDVRPLFWLVALVSLAWSLYQLPLNRVIERRLCVDYYRVHDPSVVEPDGSVREDLCKGDAVQQGLGRIQGVMETAWVVGDFVMTVPLVAVAERYGHGPVLLLNLVPRIVLLVWTFAVDYFEQIPVNAIIVAPLFSVFGGDCVFNSIVYSLVSSLTDDPVLRATFFGQMNAISSIFAFQLGPALASASMSLLLWLPLWFGIILLLLAIPVMSAIPAPPRWSLAHSRHQHHDHGDYQQEGAPLLSSQTAFTTQKHPHRYQGIAQAISSRFRAIANIVASYPLNFTLLLCGFFLTSLASSDTKLLTQYISKRYQWKFTSVGYLLSGKAIFNFALLYFVIPAILRWRRRSRTKGEDDDTETTITYAHICLVFSVLGAMAIGLSSTIWLLVPSLLLYAMGIALPMFTYSLLKSPAMLPPPKLRDGDNEGTAASLERHHHDGQQGEDARFEIAIAASPLGGAQLFSIVMLVKTSGMLVGAPLMATLWVHGVGVGGAALGLPYFVSATCYGLVIVLFTRIKETGSV